MDINRVSPTEFKPVTKIQHKNSGRIEKLQKVSTDDEFTHSLDMGGELAGLEGLASIVLQDTVTPEIIKLEHKGIRTTLKDGTTIVQNSESIYALEPKTGKEKWAIEGFKRGNERYKYMSLGKVDKEEKFLYFATRDGKMNHLDLKSGEVTKSVDFWNGLEGRILDFKNNKISFWDKTNQTYYEYDTKEKKTTKNIKLPTENWSPPVISSDGTLFVGQKNGKLSAYDTKSEKMKWEVDMGGIVRNSPLVDEKRGLIYAGSDDNGLRALDLKTGEQKWKFEIPYSMVTTPNLDREGNLFVGSLHKDNGNPGKLYAMDAETGIFKWEYYAAPAFSYQPAITEDGALLCQGNGFNILSIDKKTGRLRWEKEIEGHTFGPISVDDKNSKAYFHGFTNSYQIKYPSFAKKNSSNRGKGAKTEKKKIERKEKEVIIGGVRLKVGKEED